jgi:hypothetical protein
MATDWAAMGRSVIGLTAPGAQLLSELTESEINCFDAQKPLSVSPKVVLIPVIAHGYFSNLWKISGKWFNVDRSWKYPVVFLLWLCGSILLLMVPPGRCCGAGPDHGDGENYAADDPIRYPGSESGKRGKPLDPHRKAQAR